MNWLFLASQAHAKFSARGGAWAWALVLAAWAPAALHAAPTYYSTTGQYTASATCATPLLCGSGGVVLAANAADGNLSTAATLYTAPAAPVRLRLDLDGVAPAGYRAGVLAGNANALLSLQALGTVTLRTYLKQPGGAAPQLQETRVVRGEAARAALLGGPDRPTQLEFVSGLPFDQVEVEVGGLLNVAAALDIFYGYGVPAAVQQQVTGYLSRFGTLGAGQYSTAGTGAGGAVCANTDVLNPERAVDNNLTNYATFASLLTVACPAALQVKLEGTAPAGYRAGFVVGQEGLLDVGLLSGLRLRTYLGGVPQETASGAGLLELSALPNGQAQLNFPTTRPFDEVRLERVGAVTALDNLRLYYGFGVAPNAFRNANQVLSNFGSPGGKYAVSYNALLCAQCSVSNPQNAADGDLSPNSYAQLNVPLGAASAVGLKLDLNGAGRAGNRTGLVVGTGAGLLDAAALDQLTLLTYDAAGNLLETRAGSNLLSLGLLPDGRQEVSFLTTRDFASVKIEVAGGASLLSNTRVYYAFAEDRASVLPLNVTPPAPLPVELMDFAARRETEGSRPAVRLSWGTASERNSQYFAVERSADARNGFRAVGQVEAAGTSTAPRRYELRDLDAPAAVLYYRLRQVDRDGRTSLSGTVAVDNRAGTESPGAPVLSLYPNPAPAAEAVSLALDALPAPGGTVRVFSALGQPVLAVPAAEGRLQLPAAALPAGLYHVVLHDAAGRPLASARLLLTGR